MTTWLNWIDLVVITILIRTIYSGYSRGVLIECLKLTGAVIIIVITVNHWGLLARWLQPWVWFSDTTSALVVFSALFLSCWFGVRQVRKVAARAITWVSYHWLIQGVGMCVGGLRGAWWSGFFLLILVSSGSPFLREAAGHRSVLGPRILDVFYPTLKRVADLAPGAKHRGILVPPLWPGGGI